MNAIDPEEIRELGVRAPNWLGDSVMALPLLRALRGGVPHGRITLVGPWAEIFRHQGVADQVIACPRSFRRRIALTRVLRPLGADTALLLPNSFESALAAWSWGTRRRVGFATDGRSWLLTHPVPPPAPRRHQVDEYLRLLEVFNLRSQEPVPRWALTPGPEDAAARELLSEAGIPDGTPLAGCHLGAAFGPSKLWPVERWASLAGQLARRGVTPVLLGSPGELPVALEVERRCASPVASLVGRDTPALLPSLLSRLTLLISGDTGVAQLAAAIGVTVIALFGPTDPRLTAPRGRRVLTIAKFPPCAPCFLTVCPIDHPCMRQIGVEEVVAACLALCGANG
ncbi:MAG: glycosyltransferase family 9 protein [Candidatus Rokubacteria bacterium]|nr:glycosyltransferase family 9 protein [Candidatus Rokubacteria bacterium]